VIAHSFGTYTIASLLKRENDIDLHNLVLCGSVLPINFDFGSIARKVKNLCINDACTRDIWPVIAKILSFGYGESGTYGFYQALCRDRFHDFRHSDFFNEEFIRTYWMPIFASGILVPSAFVRKSANNPPLLRTLAILPRAILPILVLACVLISATMLYTTAIWREETRAAQNPTENVCEKQPTFCSSFGVNRWEKLECFNGLGDCQAR
jgi:hypothetical protein